MEETLLYEERRHRFLDVCFKEYMGSEVRLEEAVRTSIKSTNIINELPLKAILKGARTDKGFVPYPVLKKSSSPVGALDALLEHTLVSDVKSAFSNHPIRKAIVVNQVLPEIFEELGDVHSVYKALYNSFDSGVGEGDLLADEKYFRLNPAQIMGNEIVSPFSQTLTVNRIYDWLEEEHPDKI